MKARFGGLKISSVGFYLPEKIISNQEISLRFGTSAELIYKKTGVRERRVTQPEIQTSDMAYEAAEKIFSEHPKLKEGINALLLVGHGFDYKAPVSSAIIHEKLGLQKDCFVMDIPHGCTGYLYGLCVAKGLLNTGISSKVLLLTGDTPSFVIDQKEEELVSLFGDGATATILENSSGTDEHFVFGTDGSGFSDLIVERSGTRNPATLEWIKKTGMIHGKMKMNSAEIFTFALKNVPILIKDVLEKNSLTIDEIDYFVFHQANSFLLETLRRKIKIPEEKFFNNIVYTGNTVSSSIPLAIHQAEKNGALKRGMKVLLAGFGIGLTWGGTVINY